MKIEKFEDIIGWQKAKNLTLDVYKRRQRVETLLLLGFIKTL
ncbi:MAG: hypothetical protein UY03_C0027G0002 [Parcubacteria group bacterium GW2011_GWA2_47_64]|nr:MAG: hypothetical protein UY03_C0027G0002 [Parcubacteria group bacterium GW2011_GWA2_47_64]